MATSKIAALKKVLTTGTDADKAADIARLPQTTESYTAVSLVKIEDGQWLMRQVDITDGKIVDVVDSKPNARSIVAEYLRRAVADLFLRK